MAIQVPESANETRYALTAEEQAELDRFVQEIPTASRQRHILLGAKLQAGTLTAPEYTELIALSEAIEGAEVRRLEYLAELAAKRNCKLSEFLVTLGIPMPSYA